jgi:subtilisin family serine protease
VLKYVVAILIPLVLAFSSGKPKLNTIVIIDTGINLLDNEITKHLCNDGVISFVDNVPNKNVSDDIGHGTDVTKLIINEIKHDNYCIVVVKWWPTRNAERSYLEALNYAVKRSPTVINLSLTTDIYSKEEELLLIAAQKKAITVIAAAGNPDKHYLKNRIIYPAAFSFSLSNVISIGSLDSDGHHMNDDIYWYKPDAYEYTGELHGTSFAAAIYTGKFVNNIK